MFSSIPIHIHPTTSINIRLTHGCRTTVANTRFHKKGHPYQKSFQKMSFGFPIKSHPIPKKILIYTRASQISCLLMEAINYSQRAEHELVFAMANKLVVFSISVHFLIIVTLANS